MTDDTPTNAADGTTVRGARDSELTAVLNVLDGAALETDAGSVQEGIDRGDVLVAVSDADDGTDAETVLGALVLVGQEIEAVAVRRRRRGQGIGSALVATAADRRTRLVAEFDAGVRPFYEALGFEVESLDDGERYRGRLDPSD